MRRQSILMLVIIVLLAVLLGVVDTADAEDTYWVGTSGDWFEPANWMYKVPESGDEAYINNGGTAQITGGSPTADNVYVGYKNSSRGSIDHSGGTLYSSVYVGVSNFQDGTFGTYNLSGTGVLDGRLEVGDTAEGEFNQTGGTSYARIYLGYNGGKGTYNLSGGTGILNSGDSYIGDHGNGDFNHTGSTHSAANIFLGWYFGCTGIYNLSETGQVSTTQDQIVGRKGTGIFNQSGGTNTVGESLVIGSESGGHGTYTISSGTLNAQQLRVGYFGTGHFEIKSSATSITVSDVLAFGVLSTFTAVADSTIHMDGASLDNWNTDEVDLAGLNNLSLIFEGGAAGGVGTFEVAGGDIGALMGGFDENFALDAFILGGADVGQVQLVDWRENTDGIEAIYVKEFILGNGSYLDLNGLNLYYLNFVNLGGTIDLNGGQMRQVQGTATLLVLQPNGGESLVSGRVYPIRWSSTGSISEVLIEYSIDSGSNWMGVEPPNVGNNGLYNWLVPTVDSNQCLMRVSNMNDQNIRDSSDDVFTIEPGVAGYIDWTDLAAFVDKWLADGCLDGNCWCGFADINRDNYVDFFDFAWLAQYWEDTPPIPGQASNPEPNDTATDVSITADLSWTAGSDAAAHGVYFGTNPTPDANEFQSYQTATIFDPGIMNSGTTYYWRVDEVGLDSETTGEVWTFTTAPAPGQASNPDPTHEQLIEGHLATWYPPPLYEKHTTIYTPLTFEPGVDAVSHEAFFSDDEAKVTARDPCVSLGAPPNPATPLCFYVGLPAGVMGPVGPYNDSLVRGTTYYWCVDEFDGTDTWQGPVWSFTLRIGEAWDPDPYDFEDLISVTPLLTWERGAQTTGMLGPHEHEIYFGTNRDAVNDANCIDFTIPPEYMGSQIASSPGIPGDETWEPVADGGFPPLDRDTDYYWRIDEVHGRSIPMYTVVFKGDVWCFTTWPSDVPTQASNPSPADTATGVSITADLSWTAGSNATSHDVYFGTNPTPSVNQFQGNQLGTTFEPGTLDYETTYYWRIDEVGLGGMTTGAVWSFTTEAPPLPGQASNPNPTDTATGVSITADLSWTAGYGATSHDVYFGTNPTPDVNEFQGNQTNTAFDPGALNYETTYYWRIDEVGLGGMTTGAVWSFTTEAPPLPGQASNPNPTDTATGVSITADLSWTAGYGATSHDVYFGTNVDDVNDATTDSNEYMGNQDSNSWDPSGLDYETTYYWRIDEKNPYNTTTGEVWSFTTMPDPNLVGWWKFDETSGGIAYDSSGNENHGMLIDGIGNGLVWVPTEGALNFDGSNNLSRVMIPATAMTTTAGTIAIWANLAEPQIRGDGRNGSGYFFGCDNGVKDKILLYMDNSNTELDIRVGDHSENNIITLGTEAWYHIALTWNGGVYAVYVNGSERATGTYGGLTSLPSTADIGNNGSSSKQSFHGLMGNVQLYDKSLSAAEIQQLCQDGAN